MVKGSSTERPASIKKQAAYEHNTPNSLTYEQFVIEESFLDAISSKKVTFYQYLLVRVFFHLPSDFSIIETSLYAAFFACCFYGGKEGSVCFMKDGEAAFEGFL